jgi:hypothetical protein
MESQVAQTLADGANSYSPIFTPDSIVLHPTPQISITEYFFHLDRKKIKVFNSYTLILGMVLCLYNPSIFSVLCAKTHTDTYDAGNLSTKDKVQ